MAIPDNRGTEVGRELDRVIVGLSTDLERLREAMRKVADAIDTEVRLCAEERKEEEGWPECPVCAELYGPWRDGLRAALEAAGTVPLGQNH